jgi:transcriptional regulator with XRE-family HTH domain
MARTALNLGVRELAELAGVSSNTVSRFEAGDELKPRTVAAIRAALESAGVIFVDENGEGPGVRLRKNHMTTEPIYIDASKSAVLEHGATSINCLTVQEAVIAYHNLPLERKEIAKITSGGKVYSASEIERFHYAERGK